MGRMIFNDSSTYVYTKQVTPVDTARKQYSYAIAVLNYSNRTIHFETDLSSIGLANLGGYNVQDLWSGDHLGHYNLSQSTKPVCHLLV
uniref:Alpha galactosidase C-terminal beta sandwich domain-containing protein n=1 Tax=Ditylenchus dipsaci TaxID=166011 RepID=A0A915DAB3_9BILA